MKLQDAVGDNVVGWTTGQVWRTTWAHIITSMQVLKTAAELQKLGGANVILATAPNAQAISALVDGLSPDGKLLVPAARAEPLSINMFSLIIRWSSGWYSATSEGLTRHDVDHRHKNREPAQRAADVIRI